MTFRTGPAFALDLLRRALPQALLLIVLGTIMGFALNATRLDPLPVNLPGNLLLTESGARAVFLGKARDLFEEGQFIFIDARGSDTFIEGHIEGAFALPLEQFAELYPELQTWTAGQPLLVYGSAADIVVVDDLAHLLLKAGEKEVVLLATGFEGWTSRDYPVESGPDGLLIEESQGWPPDDEGSWQLEESESAGAE